MMWGYGNGGWPMMFGFGWIFMLLLVVLVVLAILALFRGLQRGGGGREAPPEDRALAVLRERYAKGEITEAQFQEMKQKLLE